VPYQSGSPHEILRLAGSLKRVYSRVRANAVARKASLSQPPLYFLPVRSIPEQPSRAQRYASLCGGIRRYKKPPLWTYQKTWC
jgi:hypothetical protein